MSRQNSKLAKKQVIISSMTYGSVEMKIYRSIVVLTCCRKSVLTYGIATIAT